MIHSRDLIFQYRVLIHDHHFLLPAAGNLTVKWILGERTITWSRQEMYIICSQQRSLDMFESLESRTHWTLDILFTFVPDSDTFAAIVVLQASLSHSLCSPKESNRVYFYSRSLLVRERRDVRPNRCGFSGFVLLYFALAKKAATFFLSSLIPPATLFFLRAFARGNLFRVDENQ